MNDPDNLLTPMFTEVNRLLVEMKKTKDLEKRKIQSEIVKNLCESLGVFFDTLTNTMAGGIEDDDDDEIF